MNHLCGERRGADGRRRPSRQTLRKSDPLDDAVSKPLCPITQVDHHALGKLDRRRVRHVQEEHRRRGPGIELALALLA